MKARGRSPRASLRRRAGGGAPPPADRPAHRHAAGPVLPPPLREGDRGPRARERAERAREPRPPPPAGAPGPEGRHDRAAAARVLVPAPPDGRRPGGGPRAVREELGGAQRLPSPAVPEAAGAPPSDPPRGALRPGRLPLLRWGRPGS